MPSRSLTSIDADTDVLLGQAVSLLVMRPCIPSVRSLVGRGLMAAGRASLE